MSMPRIQIVAGLCLIVSVVAFRLLPLYGEESLVRAMANVSPLAALALCGGMLLPRKMAAITTFAAFIISDVVLNWHYGFPLLNPFSIVLLASFAIIFLCGWALRGKATIWIALGGAAGSAALFYLTSNTAAFLFDPWYPMSFQGWMQALTLGRPDFQPATWVFGLRMLAGNLLFAAAFYLAMRPVGSRPMGVATEAVAAPL